MATQAQQWTRSQNEFRTILQTAEAVTVTQTRHGTEVERGDAAVERYWPHDSERRPPKEDTDQDPFTAMSASERQNRAMRNLYHMLDSLPFACLERQYPQPPDEPHGPGLTEAEMERYGTALREAGKPLSYAGLLSLLGYHSR